MIGKEAAVTHIRLNREMLLIFGFSIFVCVRSDYEVILFLSRSILVTEWLCLASMVCECVLFNKRTPGLAVSARSAPGGQKLVSFSTTYERELWEASTLIWM